jgi:hypothetical protein
MSSQHSRPRRIKQKRRRTNKKRVTRSYLRAKESTPAPQA